MTIQYTDDNSGDVCGNDKGCHESDIKAMVIFSDISDETHLAIKPDQCSTYYCGAWPLSGRFGAPCV